MPDDFYNDPPSAQARRRSNGRYLALALVAAVALGGAATLWAGSRFGWVDFDRNSPGSSATLAAPVAPSPAPGVDGMEGAQAALGVRLAELEQRMTRLNLQAGAAAGNAARAEGLLIASAARRTIERGEPLGYLEDQLKLRFGNAQPNAVETLAEVAKSPVTLDMLGQGLDALEPTLTQAPSSLGTFARLREDLANLFVIRKVGSPSPAPERRLERARTFLDSGRVEAAIGEVERMPGHAAAQQWVALATRYVRAQRALDLIETAAILEPRQLQDAAGAPVVEPSPLAAPSGGAASGL